MPEYSLTLPTIRATRLTSQADLEALVRIHRTRSGRIVGEGWETNPVTMIQWQGDPAIIAAQNEQTGSLGGLFLAGLGWWRIESSNGYLVVLPPQDEPITTRQLPPDLLMPAFKEGVAFLTEEVPPEAITMLIDGDYHIIE